MKNRNAIMKQRRITNFSTLFSFGLILFIFSACNQEPPFEPTFVDGRDNTTYEATKIVKQAWMKQNLNFAADGNKVCNGTPESCEKYGGFYTTDISKTICPEGWRVPSNKDVFDLIQNVEGNAQVGKGKIITASTIDTLGITFGGLGIPFQDSTLYNSIGQIEVWNTSSDSTFSDGERHGVLYFYHLNKGDVLMEMKYTKRPLITNCRCIKNNK